MAGVVYVAVGLVSLVFLALSLSGLEKHQDQ